MTTVRVPEKHFKQLLRHFAKSTEQVAFLFCVSDSDRSFIAKELYMVPAQGLAYESEYHSELTDAELSRVIERATRSGSILCEIHSHPFSGSDTSFSPSDKSGFSEFVPHIWWRLRGRPYLAMVFGEGCIDALAWIEDPKKPEAVDFIEVGTKKIRPTRISYIEMLAEQFRKDRYLRQEVFFGKAGQEKLAETRVGVVGLGGVGSHVVQQLAYLGVRTFALIDNDRVDGTNLNRLVGAGERDLGDYKVKVAERLIHSIQARATVVCVDKGLFSRAALDEIKKCDFIFGCVDEDGVRIVLLEASCVFQKPYIDLASDVPDESTFGGRIVFTGLEQGCPKCREEIDDDDVDWYFSSPEQRRERDRIYGVRRDALGRTGPSVVFLNGVVASIGVQEFAFYINPSLRRPIPYLVYRGNMAVLSRPAEAPPMKCYFCRSLWSGAEKSDVYRFAKD